METNGTLQLISNYSFHPIHSYINEVDALHTDAPFSGQDQFVTKKPHFLAQMDGWQKKLQLFVKLNPGEMLESFCLIWSLPSFSR